MIIYVGGHGALFAYCYVRTRRVWLACGRAYYGLLSPSGLLPADLVRDAGVRAAKLERLPTRCAACRDATCLRCHTAGAELLTAARLTDPNGASGIFASTNALETALQAGGVAGIVVAHIEEAPT